ncbi:MAG: beta-propeller fold lactonase family protein [Armatimonadota bacterium]
MKCAWRVLLVGVVVLGLAVAATVHLVGSRHVAKWTGMSGQPLNCIACHVRTKAPPRAHEAGYKTPTRLAMSDDGSQLFATARDAHALIAVDLLSRPAGGAAPTATATDGGQPVPRAAEALREVPVGEEPEGVALSPDGQTIYVSNRWEDTVSILDAATLVETERFPVGDEPCGLATDALGQVLYVANSASNDVSLINLADNAEIKRLAAGRSPYAVALGPDGGTIWVTNRITNRVPFRAQPVTELTIIDTISQTVRERRMLPNAHLVEGITFAPEGDLALVTLVRPKNLLPATQVDHGWMMTTGLGITEVEPGGRVVQVLLDDVARYYPEPYEIVITPDGRYGFVSASGADSVHVIDMQRLRALLEGATDEELAAYANDLGVSAEFVIKRLPTRANPKGLAVTPDGRFVYVSERLADSIAVIATESLEIVDRIDLGGPAEETILRRGERIFNSGAQTLYGQHSCRSCHADGHMDALTYDFEPDGLARGIVDNRTLRGIEGTAPFKWNGGNRSTLVQCGPRFARWLTRMEPFAFDDLVALTAFMDSQRLSPNRYRGQDGLTEAQLRGKQLYERSVDKEGRPIPRRNRCIGCHPGPLATDRRMADVGSGAATDKDMAFDAPSLKNIYDTAPYLHDGRAQTLEEIWTLYNPYDTHGVTNDMSKQELNDLIEYLKTL